MGCVWGQQTIQLDYTTHIKKEWHRRPASSSKDTAINIRHQTCTKNLYFVVQSCSNIGFVKPMEVLEQEN